MSEINVTNTVIKDLLTGNATYIKLNKKKYNAFDCLFGCLKNEEDIPVHGVMEANAIRIYGDRILFMLDEKPLATVAFPQEIYFNKGDTVEIHMPSIKMELTIK